jgi:hypothetical protein
VAVPTVAPDDEVKSEDHNALAGLVNGTADYGEPVKLYQYNDAANFSLIAGNQDTANGLIQSWQYGTVGSATEVARVTKAGILGKLLDKGGFVFNLLAYATAGVTINDSVDAADETAAVLAATDAAWTGAFAAVAAAGGGTIEVSPGTTLFWSSAVTPVSNCIIRGAGRDATILKHRSATVSVPTPPGMYFTGLDNVWLIDLTVDGNYDENHNSTTGFNSGEVAFQTGNDCGMLRCTVENFNYLGIIASGTRTALIDLRVIGINAASYPTANAYDSQTITNYDLRSVYGVICPGSAVSTGLFLENVFVSGTRSAGLYIGGTHGVAFNVWADNCHKGYWPDDGGGTPAGIGNRNGGGMIATTYTWDGVNNPGLIAPTGFTFINPKATGATGPAATGIEFGTSGGSIEIVNPYVSGVSTGASCMAIYAGPVTVRGGILANATGAVDMAGISVYNAGTSYANGVIIDGVTLQNNVHGVRIFYSGSGTQPNNITLSNLRFNVNTTSNLELDYTPVNFTSYGHQAPDGSTVPPNIWPTATFIGDTSNANMTLGLTINQGGADNSILAFKSSDVAHGMTTLAETDTYARFQKVNAASGGLAITGYDGTSAIAMTLSAIAGATDATRSTAGQAPLVYDAFLKSGTSAGALGADKNMVVFRDFGTVRFILDSDGDSHQDVGTAWTNFHGHDDMTLVSALAANVTRPDDPIRADFGGWLFERREELERLRLVTFNDDGHHFVNMSRLTMLLVGAVQQIATRFDEVGAELDALRSEMRALSSGAQA